MFRISFSQIERNLRVENPSEEILKIMFNTLPSINTIAIRFIMIAILISSISVLSQAQQKTIARDVKPAVKVTTVKRGQTATAKKKHYRHAKRYLRKAKGVHVRHNRALKKVHGKHNRAAIAKSMAARQPGKSEARKAIDEKTRAELTASNERQYAEKEFDGDHPDGRANWFLYPRMFPFDKVPDDARRRAWEEARTRPDLLAPEAVGTVWSSVGPQPTAGAGPGGNISGRINAIAVSPVNTQLILVAGSTGGIWRSTDGGTTFSPVSDNLADLAVGTIAFAPSNPNIVYAGLGDTDNGYFGTGVLKSTDAGATWIRINNNSLPDRARSTKIQVDPANPNKVYLAQFSSLNPANGGTILGGIYVSTDGGVSWTRTLPGLASDLVIHPTNSQIIYAALRFGQSDASPRGLFKSTDGGITWGNVFASPYTADQSSTRDFLVAVTPAAPDGVYIYFGSDGPPAQVRIEESTDAGATWTNRGTVSSNAGGLDPGQFGYNSYLAVSPVDPNTVYFGARDVFRSTNSGVTFTNLNNSFAPPYIPGNFTEQLQKIHTDQQAFAFLPGSSTTFFAGNDGGIFKTTDSGASFTSLNNTLSLVQFIGLALHPTDATRTYAGAQDNGTQRRASGSAWTEFVGGDGGKVVVNPLVPTMVFPSFTNGNIGRVLNNGLGAQATVATAADSFGETGGDSARIGFYPPIISNGVDGRLYCGSWRLFICSNCDDPTSGLGTGNPTTWTAPGGTTDLTIGGDDILSAIAVARSNTDVIYTGSRDGRASVSTNGGVNWTNITTGLPTRSIANITVSPTTPSLVYLTVSGYGTGHVFRSTNSGANWTDISSNLPNIPTAAFIIDPLTPTTLYAGTDIGVFRSTDDGVTWAVFSTGMPPVPIMQFAAQAGGLIQAATYGRGVYELATTVSPTPTPTPTPTPSPSATPTPTLTPTPTPTPSLATVDGKVVTSDLRGLRNATVSMTDSLGVVRTATTSSFGFFSFDNVPSGQTYTVRVSSRLFRFSPKTIQVNGNLTLPDFVGLE